MEFISQSIKAAQLHVRCFLRLAENSKIGFRSPLIPRMDGRTDGRKPFLVYLALAENCSSSREREKKIAVCLSHRLPSHYRKANNRVLPTKKENSPRWLDRTDGRTNGECIMSNICVASPSFKAPICPFPCTYLPTYVQRDWTIQT